MGRQTKNFRQSKRSISGNQGARNYGVINRFTWHTKIINFVKARGKGGGINS